METAEEIKAFLLEKSKEQLISCANIRKEYSKRFKINGFYTSDVISGFGLPDRSLEDNLKNLFSIASNNITAAIFSEYNAIDLRNKLNSAERRESNEKRLKQAAFLFILKHGLANEFQSFMNSYQGDTKEDIYCERLKQA